MASINDDLTGDSSMASLRNLFETLKISEARKDKLIEELFARYEYSSQRLAEELDQRDKLERNHEMFCTAKKDNQILSQNVSMLQEMMNREPFVIVLVDGNTTLFAKQYLEEGEAGGRRAADALYRGITEYLASSPKEYPAGTKVYIKAYADTVRLGKVLFGANVIQSTTTIKSFARGFNNAKPLVDFIEAPYVKGQSHSKIAGESSQDVNVVSSKIDKMQENFQLFLHDFHCRQIFLAPSDAETDIAMLEPWKDDELAKSRITLINRSIESGSTVLPFKKLKVGHPLGNVGITVGDLISMLGAEGYNSSTNGSAWKAPWEVPSPVSTPAPDSPMRRTARPSSYTASNLSSSVTSPSISNSVPNTWAGLAQKKAAAPITDVSNLVDRSATQPVRRNKKGERIDPTLPPFDKDVVERLKKLRPCNLHYLRGYCTKPKCQHKHDVHLGKAEMQSLKLIARQSLCLQGSACDEPECIYGHCCPFPAANEGSMRGKGCINGDKCRFPPHMHMMDNVPVKMTKVT